MALLLPPPPTSLHSAATAPPGPPWPCFSSVSPPMFVVYIWHFPQTEITWVKRVWIVYHLSGTRRRITRENDTLDVKLRQSILWPGFCKCNGVGSACYGTRHCNNLAWARAIYFLAGLVISHLSARSIRAPPLLSPPTPPFSSSKVPRVSPTQHTVLW